MNVTDLLSKLAGKAGINFDDPKYAPIKELKADFPEEDSNKILSSLMTFDDAKNNYSLKSYFIAAALNPADLEMTRLMEEKGLAVEDREEVNAEKSTYKKIGALVNKIESLEKQKAGTTGKDKKELQDQINALTTKIGETQKVHQEQIKKINTDWQGRLTDSTIRSLLGTKKYANKELPIDVQIETAMVILNKAIAESEAKIVNTNTGLALKQAKDEALDWMDKSNNKLSFEQFVDSLLAEKKMLEVSNAASSGASNGTNNGTTTNGAPVVQGVKPFNSGTFDSVLDSQIKEQERIYSKS